MPRGDGTGPSGQGPMTGRGMGYCVLSTVPENPRYASGIAGLQQRPVRVSRNQQSAARMVDSALESVDNLQATGTKEVSIMPRGDGTGPAGLGPMTGRAAGYCAGYGTPGFVNPIPRGGFGLGRGRGGLGRGLGLGFRGGRGPFFGYRPAWGGYPQAPYAAGYPYAPPAYGAPAAPYAAAPSGEQEMDALKGQAEYLEDALEGIQKRIAELEAAAKEKE